MLVAKENEDEDFPNPRFKKERKYSYVNDHRDRINSTLRLGFGYEFHHGRIDSYPSGGCDYSRARPPDPRAPIDVERALNETWGQSKIS
jgi:hypothetical protein